MSLSLARRRATFEGALSTGASLMLSSINPSRGAVTINLIMTSPKTDTCSAWQAGACVKNKSQTWRSIKNCCSFDRLANEASSSAIKA